MSATLATLPDALPESIDDSRALIDELDDQIIALLARRIEVSKHIQGIRVSTGGARVAQSREYTVMARYRETLERPGARVAVSVLELCRGAG